MEISANEYLCLVQEMNVLKEQNKQKIKENILLSDEIVRQREEIVLLNNQIKELNEKQQEKYDSVKETMETNAKNIINQAYALTQEKKKFIGSQFQKMKIGNGVKKMTEMENKFNEERTKNKKILEFFQNVKTLYHSTTKKKAQPSTADLLQWVKTKKASDNISINETKESMKNQKPKNEEKVQRFCQSSIRNTLLSDTGKRKSREKVVTLARLVDSKISSKGNDEKENLVLLKTESRIFERKDEDSEINIEM